jgi:RNA polymerase sigma-70 factor (ECF subfamily)
MSDRGPGLLNRAIDGDADALIQLLEGHGPTLRGFLAGKIPAHLQSVLSEDDVVQQTFADAFLGIGSFVPQGDNSFTNWLVTLAERNLTDAIRMLHREKRGGDRRRVEPAASDESLMALYELVGATTTTPSRHAARSEAEAVMNQAISRLPELYRRVVEMYDLQGRSVDEVAAALGRRPGAVFMLRERALRRLAEMMGSASDYLSGSA